MQTDTDALKYLGLLFEAGCKTIIGIFYCGIVPLVIIGASMIRKKKLRNVIQATGDAVSQTRSFSSDTRG